MTAIRLLRLGMVILSIWIVGAATSWWLFKPGAALVGAKSGASGQVPVFDLAPSDLGEAADLLNQTALWGMKRDGSVLPPASNSKEAEEKKIVWRLLASVSKGKEPYIVIKIDKEEPVVLTEGERLPDGSLLLKITPKMLTVRTPDGEQNPIALNF